MILLPQPAHSRGPAALVFAVVDTETGVGPETATAVRVLACSPPDSENKENIIILFVNFKCGYSTVNSISVYKYVVVSYNQQHVWQKLKITKCVLQSLDACI